MGQLNFAYNIPNLGNGTKSVSDGTMSFFGLNVLDSISLNTFNVYFAQITGTYTLSFGLYSLNSSTLSLANSGSQTISATAGRYISISTFSATQNITPGTWYCGLVGRTGGNASVKIMVESGSSAENNFPGSFIAGEMTESTNALPVSYETSNLDISGKSISDLPTIIISA